MDSQEFHCSKSTIGALKGHIPAQELRANKFAAELLLPEFIYKKLVSDHDPGWDAVRKLAETSQTSLLATASRFIELTSESCALIISEGSGIKRFVKSKSFNLYIDNGTPTYLSLRGEMIDDRF